MEIFKNPVGYVSQRTDKTTFKQPTKQRRIRFPTYQKNQIKLTTGQNTSKIHAKIDKINQIREKRV